MNAIPVNAENPTVEERSALITLGGQQYELVLSTLATKLIGRDMVRAGAVCLFNCGRRRYDLIDLADINFEKRKRRVHSENRSIHADSVANTMEECYPAFERQLMRSFTQSGKNKFRILF